MKPRLRLVHHGSRASAVVHLAKELDVPAGSAVVGKTMCGRNVDDGESWCWCPGHGYMDECQRCFTDIERVARWLEGNR